MSNVKTALVIVDAQYDFLPGGSLGVTDGDQIIDPLIEAGQKVDFVAFTRDFHPADHCSFSDEPKFVDKSWPPHCVQGTEGAVIHPILGEAFSDAPVFSKGMSKDREQYSGAEAVNEDGQTLIEWLTANDVDAVFVGGLATDYCVYNTAVDLAKSIAFDVEVLADAMRPVNAVTAATAIYEMTMHGIHVVTTDTAEFDPEY